MTVTMRDASTLYETAARLRVARVCIEDPDLQRFSLDVQRFLRVLGEDAEDQYWRGILPTVRRIRRELATVPLPPSHSALRLRESVELIARRLATCDKVFPAHAAAAAELVEALAAMSQRELNPLGTAARMLCDGAVPTVVILRDGRHAEAVERELACAATVVRAATELDTASRVYDRAVAIGPSSWFPRQVFAAPRAAEIHVVQFDWLRDPPLDVAVLPLPDGPEPPAWRGLPGYSGPASGGGTLAPQELLPVTDWAAIAERTGGRGDHEAERPDMVNAFLFLLASEQAVYIEADDSRAYVVELGTTKELHLVATKSIVPGTYVVTRVGGDGDYIPAIADALLGGEARRLRAEQKRWTDGLQNLIADVGMQTVCSRLAAAGSPRATSGNVRRWASRASIRTENYEDFLAIATVIGIGDEANRLWQDMDRIDQAHRRAGLRVRALLHREIQKGDTRDLERSGWQDYDVEEIEGEGSLRVARVEARGPDVVRVSARQTRQLLSVERDLWQG
jgi:hypothetical protein